MILIDGWSEALRLWRFLRRLVCAEVGLRLDHGSMPRGEKQYLLPDSSIWVPNI